MAHSAAHRVAAWFGLTRESAPAPAGGGAPQPPSRTGAGLSPNRAAAMPDVFRALSILTGSASQLSVDAYRAGAVVEPAPALVRLPWPDMSRSDWIEQVVLSLAIDGNAFLLRHTAGRELLALEVLNPHEVSVTRDKRGTIVYHHGGADVTGRVEHLHMMRLPGALRGMGPIEAARRGLTHAAARDEYLAGWWDDSGQPLGLLKSAGDLTDEQARQALNWWNHLDADGNPRDRAANPSRTRVLGNGLDWSPVLLKPADAMWIESQKMTTQQVARLFGVPSTLMLTAVDGGSKTYTNVEQEWLAFARFTLMGYLRKIEEALTRVVPRGSTVRFNMEALLRTDTASRYGAHEIAIRIGLYDAFHAARIEGIDPAAAGTTTKPAAAAPALEETTA